MSMTLLEEWDKAWSRWYALSAEKEVVNAELVAIKKRLRATGQSFVARPDPDQLEPDV